VAPGMMVTHAASFLDTSSDAIRSASSALPQVESKTILSVNVIFSAETVDIFPQTDYKQIEVLAVRMKSTLRTLTMLAAIALIGTYGVMALRGPQGVPALILQQKEIRHLQEENSNLQHEIERKRLRIDRLKNNPSEQELEIRRQLKLVKPGETTIIIPEENKK
jgi:cell division protein FtsB